MKPISISDIIIPIRVKFISNEGSPMEHWSYGEVIGFNPGNDKVWVRCDGVITHLISKSKLYRDERKTENS